MKTKRGKETEIDDDNYIINHTKLTVAKLKLFKLSFIGIPIIFFLSPGFLLLLFLFARYKRYEIPFVYSALCVSHVHRMTQLACKKEK